MFVSKAQLARGGISCVLLPVATPSGRPTRLTGKTVTDGLLTAASRSLMSVPVYAVPAPRDTLFTSLDSETVDRNDVEREVRAAVDDGFHVVDDDVRGKSYRGNRHVAGSHASGNAPQPSVSR